MRFNLNRDHLLTGIFFLSLLLLAVIQVEDTDTWLHLSMGKEIYTLRGLPANEPFTFPSLDKPFQYTSWLFGLLLYVIHSFFGYPGLVLLKAAVVILGVAILFLDSLKPIRNYAVAVLVLSIYVFQFRYRFVERPDIFLMVFLAFSVYALNAFLSEGKRYLYCLPFVNLLWANCHSSIVLMPIPFVAVIVGGFIHWWLRRKHIIASESPTLSQIKTVTVIFLVSLAATLLNPNGIGQYTYGQSIMSSAWYKEIIIELNPLTRRQMGELAAGIVVTSLSFFVYRRRFSPIHLLLVLPFVALPFSAQRFHFLFGMIAAPIVIRNFSAALEDSEQLRRFSRGSAATAGILVWITVYTSLGLVQIPPFGYPEKPFGLNINSDRVPENAVRYMDAHHINGRIFTPFHWGSYVIWTGNSTRTVFIDARGYLSDYLLNAYTLATDGDAVVMDYLSRTYGFEVVLLDYPPRELVLKMDKVMSQTSWALVYWDDMSMLYLKRGGKYESLIREDEYITVKPAKGKNGINTLLDDAGSRAQLELELQRNVRTTSSAQGLAFLGYMYNNTGRHPEAIELFTQVTKRTNVKRLLPFAYSGLGDAYYDLGQIEKSLMNYKIADALTGHKNAVVLYNMAGIHIAQNDSSKAIECLSAAIKADSMFLPAHERLIRTYERLGENAKAVEAFQRYEEAKRKISPH